MTRRVDGVRTRGLRAGENLGPESTGSGRAISRRGVLSGVAAAGLVAATAGCAPAEQQDTSERKRWVTHPLGRSNIPADPSRVIALDPGPPLQVALEHGVPLVASATLSSEPSVPEYLPDAQGSFRHLGFNEFDPEVLAGLNPDLIVGNEFSLEDQYGMLSDMTSVASYANTRNGVEWQESCLTVADYYGYREQQRALLDKYRKRAEETKKRYRKVLDSHRLALLRFTTDELRVVTDSVIFPARVLADCGVRLTESSTPDEKGDTYNSLSQEQVSRIDDADALIYFGGGGGFEGDPVNSTFTNYTESTLWQRLPAVRDGKVYQVSQQRWWDGYSSTAAQRIIDELEGVLDKL